MLKDAEFHLFKKNKDGTSTQVKTPSSLVTGEDGKVRVDSLEYGDYYYFIEHKAPNGYITSKEERPFSIKESGEVVKLEDIKNYKEPTITKSINNGSKVAGINKETDYTYDIKTLLPEDIKLYKKYVVTDILDDRLK